MANEAYVKVSEVLKDAPASVGASTEFLVAGVIKSRYGDYEPTYFSGSSGRKQFLDKYTCDGKLTGKCDVSLVNAYEILGSCPILVTRAASKEYPTFKIEDEGMEFNIEFTDFLKDPNFEVEYTVNKSDKFPGATNLNIRYVKLSDLYKYSDPEVTDSPSNKYNLGDVVTLYLNQSESSDVIKCKVTGVNSGSVTSVKLLTSVGSLNVIQLSDLDGLLVSVTASKLENTLIKEYNLVFALDENVVDDKGNSLYYENVWSNDYPFKVNITGVPTEVTVSNPYKEFDPTQPDTLTYMDYGPSTEVTGVTKFTAVSDASEIYDPVEDPSGIHWSVLGNYEDRKIPVFIDFGTPNIGSQLSQLANQFDGMYCNSLPRLSESVNGASAWNDLDLGNSRRYACTPFALTTNLGFIAQIAPTTQYIKTLCTNMSAGREFDAIAGKNTGVVSYSKLTKNYDKSEREKLLDLKINTITYREVDGYAMFNDDLTGLVINNPFKEEFNRRLGVRIAQDVDTLMKQFLFRLNTASLRDTVETTLNTYFETAPFKSKIYTYQVICNDDNNPPSLQAQNKLAVTVNISFYYTAKFIEVVNNIYSVGQSFTE
jgi:hypothetical protein